MKAIDYIRESCEHQLAIAPEDYIGMTLAYNYVVEKMWLRNSVNSDLIYMSDLAPIICAVRGGSTWVDFRRQPATFIMSGGRTLLNDPESILRALKNLLEAQERLSPAELYREFEMIHPWADGNGRVGSLLFNFRNDSIIDPIHPPEPDWMVPGTWK